MTTQPASQSLYEQLGGQPAVDAAVEIFYRKVLADDRVSRFFASVDMERQIGKQKAFLTMVFGGPSRYNGKSMRGGHSRFIEMGLDDMHVDAVIENLGSTLAELGVAPELIAKVAAIAESVRNEVLNR